MNVNDIRKHIRSCASVLQAFAGVAASPELGVLLSDEDEAFPALPYLGSKPAMGTWP